MSTQAWLIMIFVLTCCTYATRRIDGLERRKIDSKRVYVMDPISESRIQITRDSSMSDYDGFNSLNALVNISLRKSFDGYCVTYDSSKLLPRNRTKIFLDSLLARFKKEKYKELGTGHPFPISATYDLVLVSYFVWTRTIDDFEKEKCGRDGYKIYVDNVCTWTEADLYLFGFNHVGKIVYYRRSIWVSAGVIMPYAERVDHAFKMATKEFVQVLRK